MQFNHKLSIWVFSMKPITYSVAWFDMNFTKGFLKIPVKADSCLLPYKKQTVC